MTTDRNDSLQLHSSTAGKFGAEIFHTLLKCVVKAVLHEKVKYFFIHRSCLNQCLLTPNLAQ